MCSDVSMYFDQKYENWDEVLPQITFAYNCSKQDSTRCSPFELVYARDPILPIDVAIRTVVNEEPREPKTDFADEMKRRAVAMREWVKEHLPMVQRRQKERYDEEKRFGQYQPGDVVLVYKAYRKKGLSETITPIFEPVHCRTPIKLDELHRQTSRSGQDALCWTIFTASVVG